MALTKEYKEAVVSALEKAQYNELFGLTIPTNPAEWTAAHESVLLKFWVANEKQLEPAKEQLLKTLEWRKDFNPLKAANEEHDAEISKLGIITQSPEGVVVTWNLYGAVKDPGAVFENVDKFLRWRVGLHERALAACDFANPKLASMAQVHDYMNVSFLRMDGRIKKASSAAIKLFQDYYPETLSNKYFVNVPYIMMWVFKLVRAVTSEATTAKFHVLANGDQLNSELGEWVPKEYGGKGKPLREEAINPKVNEVDASGKPLGATTGAANKNGATSTGGANGNGAATNGSAATNGDAANGVAGTGASHPGAAPTGTAHADPASNAATATSATPNTTTAAPAAVTPAGAAPPKPT